MEPIIPEPEFFFPGTFEVEPPYREGTPENMHLAGLDGIDPAYDANNAALTGVIGFDPMDLISPSLDTREDIEHELPQWGPPFVKFVDGRISDLEKKVNEAIEKWSFQTQTYFNIASLNTDASGNIGTGVQDKANILEPPPGFTIALHRFSIFPDGSTFGTPFTAAGAYWELRIGNETIDGGSMVSGVGSIPVVRTYGTRDALRIRDGEILSFFMSAGPASKRITLKMQSSVDRTIEG